MIDLTLLGAVPAMATTGPKAGIPGWNFGVQGKPGRPGPIKSPAPPRMLYDVAPWTQGRWDGRTICCHDAALKVLGKHLDAQMQPKGTCGGRAAKRGLELLQLMLIATGWRATFRRVSHAWPYALARKDSGILGPQDGVLDGSIPPVMAKYGCITFDEAGERSDYGPGSDDLAAKWGYSGPPQALYELARDNKIGADFAQVRSVAEMYDGFAAGGIAIVSDDNGYTMQRDKDGCCKPVREPWYHYHLFSGVAVLPNGARKTAYDQSWGRNTPGGPTLLDGRWPDWSFGIDESAAEETCRNNTVHMIFAFELWDEKAVMSWADIQP